MIDYNTDGSSPQVRGTRRLRGNTARLTRFIPAGTGNSISHQYAAVRISVHPRRYGELDIFIRDDAKYIGSSPQVRGTRLSFPVFHRILRFIPAGTGNSAPALTSFCAVSLLNRQFLKRRVRFAPSNPPPSAWALRFSAVRAMCRFNAHCGAIVVNMPMLCPYC